MRRSAWVFVLALMLVGCGGNQVQKFDSHSLMLQLATSAATARVLDAKPEWRERTVEIADIAIGSIDGGVVGTVDELVAVVKAEVRWEKMLPEEQALVSVLIDAVAQEIRNYLEAGGYATEEADAFLVRTRLVMLWVRDTAQMGGGK